MPARDPFHDPDEPQVARWPRALRLLFLLLVAVAGWAGALILAWVVWRRMAV